MNKKLVGYFCVSAIILSIPFSYLNFNSYLMGDFPNKSQAIASILFNVIWFCFGLYMAIKKRTYFIKFTTGYWVGGCLLSFLGYSDSFELFGFLSIPFFAGPSYGLRYFIELPSDKIFLLFSMLFPYVLSLIGYFIGRITINMNSISS